MIFSTLKKDRLVSRDFLKSIVLKHRAIGEYITARPWSGTNAGFVPFEPRVIVFCIPVIYFFHYYHYQREFERNELNACTVKRWGPSLEEAKQKLSNIDMLHVRCGRRVELKYGVLIPQHLKFKPNGCELPGKEIFASEGHH